MLEPLAAALDTSVVALLNLEDAAPSQVAAAVSAISIEEKKTFAKELKIRGIVKIVYELVILCALVIASKIFADNQIWGLAQAVTMGMIGCAFTLLCWEVDALRKLSKLI